MNEYVAMEDSNDLTMFFDATASMSFSWLCRIIGGDFRRAATLLTETYIELAVRNSDSGPFSQIDCLAAAYTRATSGSAPPLGLDAADLSITDRALLDLTYVQHRSAAEVALVLGIPVDAVADAVVDATRAAQFAGAGAPIVDTLTVDKLIVDTLRRADHWLDEITRANCRAALSSGRASMPSSVAPPDEVSRRRAYTAKRLTPRQRRLAWSAGSMLAVGAAVAWVLPDTSSDVGATRTSTPLAVSPASVVDVSATPGFIATDLPDGFVPLGASNTGGGVDGEASVGVFQLWAQQGASRHVGKWFAVVSSTGGLSTSIKSETASRVEIRGVPGLYDVSADGVAEIMSETPGALHAIDLVAHGFERQELENLAASVGNAVSADVAPDASLNYGPEFDLTAYGLTRLVSSRTWSADIRNQPVPAVVQDGVYRNPTTGARISIRTIPTTPAGSGAATLIADRFLLDPSRDPDAPVEPDRTMTIGDRRVSVSSTRNPSAANASDAFNNIEWEQDGTTIIVSGSVPLKDLATVAHSVKLASLPEWSEFFQNVRGSYQSVTGAAVPPNVDQVNSNSINLPVFRVDGDHPGYVSYGDDQWLVSFGLPKEGLLLSLEHGTLGGSGGAEVMPFAIDSPHSLHVYNSIAASLQVVAVRDPGSQRVLFTFPDGVSVEPEWTIIRADVGYAAAVAYTATAPSRVELVDANGAVVQTLTP